MSQKGLKNISNEELCKLASEVWKLEKRLSKNDKISSEDKKSYNFFFDRIYSIIKWYDVEILDYTWKKYISWMNWFDIVWSEHDWSLSYDIVWESITPMVKIDWKIIQNSKIIIKTPDELEVKEWDKSDGDINKHPIWKIIIWSIIILLLLLLIRFVFSWNIDGIFCK